MSVLGQCLTSANLDPKWKVFPSILESKHVSIVPVGNSESTHYFSLEHDGISLALAEKVVKLERRTLIIVEPRSVHPEQFRKNVRDKYGKIIALSRRHLNESMGEIWEGGHLATPPAVIAEVMKSQLLVRKPNTVGLINENKFSLIAGSQYKKRYLVINEFLDNGHEFSLAGKDWDRGLVWTIAKQIHSAIRALSARVIPDLRESHLPMRVKSKNLKYFGRVDSQFDFLRTLQFAVVIENEANYVTEKLLNAVIAGCVPLFFGPPLSEFGIPDDVAIQINGLNESFYDGMQNCSCEKIDQIILKGREWITSPSTLERWGVLSGFERLASRIEELSVG